MTYAEKLRSPKWQRVRLHILDRDLWKCVCCGCEKENLQVHHKRYFKNTDPWDYDEKHLETLCETCHFIKEFLPKVIKGAERPFMIIRTMWGSPNYKILLAYCYDDTNAITRILKVNLKRKSIKEIANIPNRLKPRKLLRRYEKKGR